MSKVEELLNKVQLFFRKQQNKSGMCAVLGYYMSKKLLKDMTESNIRICTLFDQTYILGLQTVKILENHRKMFHSRF